MRLATPPRHPYWPSPHPPAQFCPTNPAFEDFATDLGVQGPNLDKQLLAAAAASPDLFKTVLSYHIAKGVLPSPALKNGQAVATLLAEKKPTLKIMVDAEGVDLVHPDIGFEPLGAPPEPKAPAEPGVPAGMHADEVVAADLTFEGPFVAGKSKYVVHSISDVLVPEAVLAGLKKAQAAITAKSKAAAAKPAPAKPAPAKPAGRKLAM